MPDLERLFRPRSIVIAGASNHQNNAGRRVFLRALLDFSFDGPIYVVNTQGEQVLGHKVYRNIKDIPGQVDYVIASIPAKATIDFMKDCVSKQVKAVHFFTSGFREMDEEGASLEVKLVRIAAEGGVRIIGPNCMGIYNPGARFSFRSDFPKESGSISFLSQSGGNATQFIKMGAALGLRFGKVVSFGNAADLNEADFLEYFARDPQTKIIGAYLEGVRNGRRFFKVLKNAVREKPVIIIKGGRTHAGSRAIASHTGSLIGNEDVWNAIFKQTHAIQANSLEELIDVILALEYLPVVTGKRIGVVGTGGGASVHVADECEARGLTVPVLSEKVQNQLKKFIYFSSTAGSTFNNPVDTPLATLDPEKFYQIMNVMADSTDIDLLVGYIGVDVSEPGFDIRNVLMTMANTIIDSAKTHSKPTMIVADSTITETLNDIVTAIRRKAQANGLVAFPSIDRAANAISKIVDYYIQHGQAILLSKSLNHH